VHFKTSVRDSDADERRAKMKETKVGYRHLYAHIAPIAPGFEMHSKAVGCLEAVLEEVVFEMKMSSKSQPTPRKAARSCH
jgi:hypothetical protein